MVHAGSAVTRTEPGRAVAQFEVPASYLQEEWFEASGGRFSNHNVTVAWDLTGALNVDALQDALRLLAARHESLRSEFVPGRPLRQRISTQLRVDLPTHDLPGSAPVQALAGGIRRLTAVPFDLTSGPLWRSVLVRLRGDHHVLVLVLHHLIFDGHSHAIAHHDLVALYRAAMTGRPTVSGPPAIQHGDYASWEREPSQFPPATRHYWRSTLLPVPAPLALPRVPFSYPRRLRSVPIPPIPANAVAELGRVASDEKVGRGSAFRAVVIASLVRFVTDDDVVVGMVVSNRDRVPGLTSVVGLVSDHAWLRVRVSDEPSFVMLMRRAQEAADASARHAIATGRLREEFGLAHIGDVSVNYLPGRLPSDRVDGPGGTLQISAREITSDGIMPTIGRPFSGAPLLGYQFRSDGARGLTGEIWAHHPTLETALVERLARNVGAALVLLVNAPHRAVVAVGLAP
jgi:hypothetical protein